MLKRGAVATHIPPIVQHLFSEMKSRNVDAGELARRTGLASRTIDQWRRGDHPPSIGNLETAFAALGLRLSSAPLMEPP